MPAAVHNLNLEKGIAFARNLLWKDSDGVAVDLTGRTAKLQIRSLAGALLVELTELAGITLGGVAGTIVIVITSAQTDSLPVGSCKYEFENYVGTEPTKMLRGRIEVEPRLISALP